jgi:predicted transcriptional regulator
MPEKANMAVKLDTSIRQRLQALGHAKRRSPHWLMVEAIRLYVDREEELEREKAITRERLAHYDATGEYVAGDDVDAWLRSIGASHEKSPPTRLRHRHRKTTR